MEKLVLERLEALAIAKHVAEQRTKNLENELLLMKSSMEVMKSAHEDEVSKLRFDLRESINHFKRMMFEHSRTISHEKKSRNLPLVIGEPPKKYPENYSLGPPVPKEQWDDIIKVIIHDTSVPESERHPLKQTMRLRHALGVSRPDPKSTINLVREARLKYGMPEAGPSIPDVRKPIILPPPSNNTQCVAIKPNKIIEIGGQKLYNNKPIFGTACHVEL